MVFSFSFENPARKLYYLHYLFKSVVVRDPSCCHGIIAAAPASTVFSGGSIQSVGRVSCSSRTSS